MTSLQLVIAPWMLINLCQWLLKQQSNKPSIWEKSLIRTWTNPSNSCFWEAWPNWVLGMAFYKVRILVMWKDWNWKESLLGSYGVQLTGATKSQSPTKYWFLCIGLKATGLDEIYQSFKNDLHDRNKLEKGWVWKFIYCVWIDFEKWFGNKL